MSEVEDLDDVDIFGKTLIIRKGEDDLNGPTQMINNSNDSSELNVPFNPFKPKRGGGRQQAVDLNGAT